MKAVEIDLRKPLRAMRVDALHLEDIEDFVGGDVGTFAPTPDTIGLVVATREGGLPIAPGMWVVEYAAQRYLAITDEVFTIIFESKDA